MEKQGAKSPNSTTEDPGVKQAKLPDEIGGSESSSPSDPNDNGQSIDSEDRDAIPSDDNEDSADSKLQRYEETIHGHQRNEVEFSRAALEIIQNRLYTVKGFESLGSYTKSTFGVGQNQFRKYSYHAKVFDIIEENQEEIAGRSLTNIREVPLPYTKAWTRPLHSKANKGLEEEVIETWAAVVRCYESSITGKRVEKIREEVLGEDKNSAYEEPGKGKDSIDETPNGFENGESNADPSEWSDSSSEEGIEEKGATESAGSDTSDKSFRGGSSDGSSAGNAEADAGNFSVDVPDEAETQNGAASSQLTQSDLEDFAEVAGQDEEGFSSSSAEHMVASMVWRVLDLSEGIGAGLPEEGSSVDDPAETVLEPGRLGQITDLDSGTDGERVLVCPGVDLFSEVVPDSPIDVILKRCRKTAHKPVVFTRHLSRASEFDLSGMWVGTSTTRSSLEMTEQRLGDAAPNATVRWLLYDVAQTDKDDAPSFSDKIDWVVYDPGDRNSGIALKLSEARALIDAAREADAEWAFRDSFKTCGASLATPYSSS